ncbi:MAG: cation:proton antiporter [Actinomycetes bacterium]
MPKTRRRELRVHERHPDTQPVVGGWGALFAVLMAVGLSQPQSSQGNQSTPQAPLRRDGAQGGRPGRRIEDDRLTLPGLRSLALGAHAAKMRLLWCLESLPRRRIVGALILLVVAVGYGAFSRRLDRLWISAPMVFVAAGLALGPEGADLLDVQGGSHVVLSFTELTLAALLFADATTVPLQDLKGDANVPVRLLSVGLLLTLGLGALVAMLVVPGVTWAEAALIAAVLAPTDAALGMAVVTDKAVPVRIRRALNIESGLNDGIATPFVTVFLAVVVGEVTAEGGSPVADALRQIAIAVVVAVVVGVLGGRVLVAVTKRSWSSHTSRQLFVLTLAFVAYVGSVELGGNGFVSAFVAGLVFGAVDEGNRAAISFTEDVALFASLLVWVIFGSYFAGPVLAGDFDTSAVVYAVLSLTLIRMVPVGVALLGTGFRTLTSGFMGWFGPRGLASVVFTLIAVEDLQGTKIDTPLFQVATWTILLSVVLHGLTARPLSANYGAKIRSGPDDLPELIEMPEPRVRRHLQRTSTLSSG